MSYVKQENAMEQGHLQNGRHFVSSYYSRENIFLWKNAISR